MYNACREASHIRAKVFSGVDIVRVCVEKGYIVAGKQS